MRRPAYLLLLLATTVFAEEPAPAIAPPVPASAVALYAGSAALVLATSAAVAIFAGGALPNGRFEALGRPDPLALAGGLAIGLAVNLALSHLLVPELTELANRDGWSGSSVAARDEAWRAARWAAVAAAVGVVAMAAGALLERNHFGSGEGVMAVGGGLFLAGTITWDVLEPVFAWQGFARSRRAEAH